MNSAQGRKIAFRERAFPVGDLVGVNAYRIKQEALERRIRAGAYDIKETPHFMICTRPAGPTLLVHRFAPAEIDGNLGAYLLEELKPLDILTQPQHFGDLFAALVGSLSPAEPQRAWHLFGSNTLRRYEDLLAMKTDPPQDELPLHIFATLYKRTCQLIVGESLLDAGCSFGFLPLVVAGQLPSLTCIVGIDIQTDPFPVTRAIAAEHALTNVHFMQADLLSPDFVRFAQHDTVTALHVLEHFTEDAMYRVLKHLLSVTKRRLIVAVPYETDVPEVAYGHEQLFTRAKLEAVGAWCLEQMGAGQFACEECAGGLLVVDRADM